MESYGYDEQTGKPLDKTYLEKDIPRWLQNSIQEMQKHWAILDEAGSPPPHNPLGFRWGYVH